MTSRKIPESAVENLVSDLEGKANVSNTVTTNTNQTITGQKEFTAQLLRKSTNIDVTSEATSTTYNTAVRFFDKNGKDIGAVNNAQMNGGNIRTVLEARNKDGYVPAIGVQAPYEGSTGGFGYAPNTPDNAPDNAIATVDYIRKFLNPTGTIIIWSASTPPAGYLVCNGAAISRTTYERLFQVIGTTWGAGDGSTTFNVPNFVDRIPQGSGSRGTVGALLNESLPNITGDYNSAVGYTNASKTGAFKDSTVASSSFGASGSGVGRFNLKFSASKSSSTYKDNAPVQQAATVVNFCIRY